ncbi:hypothetical protein FHS96_004946 [Sphingomonas zeicaulis]|uniref:hypothetical protein n=1 Tax=Sphingomonas zeicaulis TaxID=1632740 RepID=UPI003D2123F0
MIDIALQIIAGTGVILLAIAGVLLCCVALVPLFRLAFKLDEIWSRQHRLHVFLYEARHILGPALIALGWLVLAWAIGRGVLS